MIAEGSGSPDRNEISRKLPGFMGELTVDVMIKYGFYSKMKMNPIDYHGYRRTESNIKSIIEEIDYELALRPQDSDTLLDHRNNMLHELTLL